MSGHSKWATIKHKKAALDAKRGKLFTRLIKEITIAARNGGDPDANPRLRTAILAAKAVSMPADNIKRAIQRGTGEIEGAALEEVTYEGYGPGGVAIMCDVLTDNRNRTAAEIRKCFELHNGKLGSTGCVGWMFETKGLFLVPANQVSEERLMEVALEAGAEDIKQVGDKFEVTCDPSKFSDVSEALDQAGIPCDSREVTRIPKDYVDLDADTARKVLKLMEELDEHDDVQNVSANFNIPDEVMAELGQS